MRSVQRDSVDATGRRVAGGAKRLERHGTIELAIDGGEDASHAAPRNLVADHVAFVNSAPWQRPAQGGHRGKARVALVEVAIELREHVGG